MVFSAIMDSYGLSQAAGLFRRVEDLIVEDREVESQAQTNGVCGLHLLLAYLKCLLIRLLRVIHCGCKGRHQPKNVIIYHYTKLYCNITVQTVRCAHRSAPIPLQLCVLSTYFS